MDIAQRIRRARNLTPTEQHLAMTVLTLGERVQGYTIKELAQTSATSVATIHRLCRKLGLEGFKELKVELARGYARGAAAPVDVDVDFPFNADERADAIAPRMALLYEETLRETREVLSLRAIDHAARLIDAAKQVDIYAWSHNAYPAELFSDRLLSVGKQSAFYCDMERETRMALAAGSAHVALFVSYSGLSPFIPRILPLLIERGCPVILVGTVHAQRRHPGLDEYLLVSDHESLNNRIAQFASHISVQYVLDTLFSCYFARDYQRHITYLEQALPYANLSLAAGRIPRPTGDAEGSSGSSDATLFLLQQTK